MTYREWEYELKRLLSALQRDEVDDVLKFYREIYNDKRDAGISERDIVLEFGSPKECAEKILAENGQDKDSGVTYAPRRACQNAREKKATRVKGNTVSKVIGLILLTIIIYIPAFSVLFGLVVGFAAICIAGGAAVLAGAGGVIAGFFNIFTATVAEGFMLVGLGLGAVGAGIFLAIVFFYATKYSAVGLFKAFKALVFK